MANGKGGRTGYSLGGALEVAEYLRQQGIEWCASRPRTEVHAHLQRAGFTIGAHALKSIESHIGVERIASKSSAELALLRIDDQLAAMDKRLTELEEALTAQQVKDVQP